MNSFFEISYRLGIHNLYSITRTLIKTYLPYKDERFTSSKMTCGSCSNGIQQADKILKCNLCEISFHISCINLSPTNFMIISKLKNFRWLCNTCNKDEIFKELREMQLVKNKIIAIEETLEILKQQMETRQTVSPVLGTPSPALERDNMVDLIREERDIEKRKLNLCVFNLPEAQDDKQLFTELCTDKLELQQNEVRISEIVRVGNNTNNKPKLAIIKFENTESRRKVLKNAPKLKNYTPDGSNLKIFIAPDFTKKQQAQQKNLRDELRDRRANGENVRISRNQIVSTNRNSDPHNSH